MANPVYYHSIFKCKQCGVVFHEETLSYGEERTSTHQCRLQRHGEDYLEVNGIVEQIGYGEKRGREIINCVINPKGGCGDDCPVCLGRGFTLGTDVTELGHQTQFKINRRFL